MASQIAVPDVILPDPTAAAPRSFPFWEKRPRRHPSSSHTRAHFTPGPRGALHLHPAEIQQLVIALLPLVKCVAMKMRERLPLHVELDDLVSTGVLGLVDAIHKFDARKHVRLDRYAQHRIRGAILDGLRGEDGASRDMRTKNKRARRVYERLETKLGRPPSDAEMAEGLGISLVSWYRTVRELQAIGIEWLRPMGSVGIKQARSLSEDTLAADNQNHQFEACYRREQREILDGALERIPDRERQVVQLYYQQELTMREIGERLGIDESRVSQLHSTALLRLRKRVRNLLQNPVPAAPRLAW